VIRIAQRNRTDCGIACVAMLARVSYEDAKAAFRSSEYGKPINAKACIRALRRLGVKILSDRFKPLGPDNVETLKHNALLKANMRRKNWHWVVFDASKKVIIDPASFLIGQSKI